jgi:peptidoglycan/LPS O-acetylase OafA/YrhL
MSSQPNAGKQFAGLEIARFLCALAVMFWHYQVFFVNGVVTDHDLPAVPVEEFPFYLIFSFFYNNGHFAVQIFWMISGFIFLWKYSKPINEGIVSAYQFFVLRFSRLYPLHFVTLIVVTLLQLTYIETHGTSFVFGNTDAFHFALQLVFASNWVNELPQTFNGPIWSVSVEVLVYVFFLIVVSFLRPSLVLCVVVAAAAKAASHFYPQYVFECIQYFFVGGALQAVGARLSRRYKLVAFGVCVLGLCVSIATNFRFGSVIGFSFFVVASFALLDEVVPLRRSAVTKVGDLTYASYLLHFPIQLATVLAIDAMGFTRKVFLAPWALVAFFLATFGLAWVVFRVFEMPAQDALRTAWLGRRKRVATTTA